MHIQEQNTCYCFADLPCKVHLLFGRTSVDAAAFISLLLSSPGCHRHGRKKIAVQSVHAGVIIVLNRRRVITFVWFLPALKSNKIETSGYVTNAHRSPVAFTKSEASYVKRPVLTS